ncbi:MAG: GntR family transcriptional regulator [Rhodospirillaceae bacterium]
MQPKRTLTEELRQQIADDIVTGRILPGARLDETALADRFGVSRTPVREALKALVAIGLAEQAPQRSTVAATVTEEKLHDLFEVMAELEGVCARLAARRMRALERKQLEELHFRSGDVMRRGDAPEYGDLNLRFHALIYAGSHNRQLEDMALATRNRLAPFRTGQFNVVGRLGKSFGEHDGIVTAILRGDAERAYAQAVAHVSLVSDASTEYIMRRVGLSPAAVND